MQILQSFLLGQAFQPLDHLHGPPLESLYSVHILLVLRAPKLHTALGGMITSLSELEMPLWMQPQMQLAFAAAAVRC